MWQKPQQQKQQVCSAAKVIFGFLSTNPTWAPGLCILLLGWAAVQFALVAFQRKNLSLENALGSFRGEARAFRSPGSHSEDTLRIKSMLKMLQLLPTHKNPLRVTLLQPVAHLDLPTDRKEHSRLRATPLTEELSHCKIKVTPCPQDRGNLEISGLQEEIWSPNKIQQGFPQSA